jgi:hypothetical protein
MNNNDNKSIIFHDSYQNDLIKQFIPNLTPYEIFQWGSFGGSYFRPIYSGVLNEHLSNFHIKYKHILYNIPLKYLTEERPNVFINKYKVHSGSDLLYWESKNWIHRQDPYGWVQWYCEFFQGRRSEDDERQIKRWLKFAGPKGRFRINLINKIKSQNKSYDDISISPTIRQALQHWGYCLTYEDFINN